MSFTHKRRLTDTRTTTSVTWDRCGVNNKIKYSSQAKARQALIRWRQLGMSVRSAYRCPHCGEWHLTSREKKDEPHGT